MPDQLKPCRHHRTWLVSGGRIEWCYECGAIRRNEVIGCIVSPAGWWVRPTGKGGKNPYTPRFDGVKQDKTKAFRHPEKDDEIKWTEEPSDDGRFR